MCEGCWEEYGSPQVDNEKVRHAAKTVQDLYVEELVGGQMHIVTDEWSLEDDMVAFCAEKKTEMNKEELACLAAFQSMTVEERASALALSDGFWRVE